MLIWINYKLKTFGLLWLMWCGLGKILGMSLQHTANMHVLLQNVYTTNV